MRTVSLRVFLVGVMAACLLPALGLGVWLAQRHVSAVHADQAEQARRLALNAALMLDQHVEARLEVLGIVASRSPASTPRRPEAGGVERLGEGFDSPVYAVATPIVGPPEVFPAATWAVAVEVVRGGRPRVGPRYEDGPDREPTAALMAPDPRFPQGGGMLWTPMRLRDFEARLRALEGPRDWRVTVLDRQEGRPVLGAAPTRADSPVTSVEALTTVAPWRVRVDRPAPPRPFGLSTTALAMALAVLGSAAAGLWIARRAAVGIAGRIQGLAVTDVGADARRGLNLSEIEAVRQRLEQAGLALQVREAQLRGIFDSASEAIVTVDPSQRVVMANAAAARMFGRPMESLVGAALGELMPPRFRDHHAREMDVFMSADSPPRPMGSRPDVVGWRADGTEFPVEAAISQVHVDGQRLATAILRDVTERRQAEQALRDSQERLQAALEDLQHLIAAQDSVQEQERARIARELHDDLQQTLAAVLMELTALHGGREAIGARTRDGLDRIDTLTTAAIASLRRIVRDLRPLMLEELGLMPALRHLATEFSARTGVACEVEDPAPLSPAEQAALATIATCLYRVAQEALNNVAKHARARRVRVRLARRAPRGLEMTISDDGVGLPDAPRRADAFGLLGMHERVRAVGGRLSVRPGLQGGTTVEIVWDRWPAPPARQAG